MSGSKTRRNNPSLELELYQPAAGWVDSTCTKPGELPLALTYWVRVRAGSKPAMRHALQRVAEVSGYEDWRALPWGALTPEVVTQILLGIEARGYGESTLKRASVAIVQIVRLARRRGLYSELEAEYIEEAARRYPRQKWQPSAGRRLSRAECQQQIRGAPTERDRLLLKLGLVYGLRRGELCDLKRTDLDPVMRQLRVLGKGVKVRHVPLGPQMVRELATWKARLDVADRGEPNPEAPMFPAPRGGKFARRTMWTILNRARLAAGVDKWSPHDLRRTAVTQLLEAGHDPVMVAKAVGHSSVNTTMIYDHRGDEATRGAFGGIEEGLE